MIKRTTANGINPGDWFIFDYKMAFAQNPLLANQNLPEQPFGSDYSPIFVDSGFTLQANNSNINDNNTFIYIAIAAPAVARSMTEAEFVEADLKLTSYDYRKAAYALDVERQKQALIDDLTRKGYTPEQVTQAIGD